MYITYIFVLYMRTVDLENQVRVKDNLKDKQIMDVRKTQKREDKQYKP